MVTSPRSPSNTVKFLCSYGGKILPRHPDVKLRYIGGETRVLAVDRSISFAELMVKLSELYGSSVILRCQLPEEDLDALVSITSDEDLKNIIEEYDLADQKIRAFLWPQRQIKKDQKSSPAVSSLPTPATCSMPPAGTPVHACRMPAKRYVSPPGLPKSPHTPIGFPVNYNNRSNLCYYNGTPRGFSRPVHNGNHWQ